MQILKTSNWQRVRKSGDRQVSMKDLGAICCCVGEQKMVRVIERRVTYAALITCSGISQSASIKFDTLCNPTSMFYSGCCRTLVTL